MKALPWLKTTGICGFIAVFFAAYFETLLHPVFPVTLMPVTLLDRAIPFLGWTVPVYCTLWVYVIGPAALADDWHALGRYGAAAAALAGAGLVIFFFWPTTIPTEGTGFLKAMDRAGNACPSLHVAFAVFAARCVGPMLRELGAARWLRVASWTWCLLIVGSTLTTKQHLALDVAAGAPLGMAAAWLHNRCRQPALAGVPGGAMPAR